MRRGTRVGQAYVAVTADGSGINEDIADAFDEVGDDIDKRSEDHGEAYGDGFSEGFLSRMRGRIGSRLSSVLSANDSAGRAGDDAGDSFVERMSEKVKDLGDKVGAELSDRLASNPEQVRRGIDRAFDDDFIDRVGDRLGSRLVNGMTEAIDRQSGALSAALSDAVSGNGSRGRRGGADDGIGGIIGRMFGAGARNNVLNLLGRTIGGVVSLTERAGKFATGFAEGLGKAAENASLIQRLMAGLSGGAGASGIAGVLSKIAASGPIAVVALAAVIFTMSAMASVAGALVGILTALVSTIASGLVGALAIVGPLLGAITVAGGLVVNAFTSMTNAQKDYLFNAFQPFKAALTGVGQIVMQEFVRPLYDGQSAIQVWSANLQKALLPLAGVAAATAGAFAQAGNIITASLSGPGFQRFFAALGRELPSIVLNLSSALGRALNGIGGMFAAIMPYVTQFSRYLNNVATSFSNWANSARGQNAIQDFVRRALDSLKSLWGAVKEIGGFIGDVLFSPTSQRAGNSIFDSIAKTFAGFRRSFQRNIANGNIEKWFNDAIEFGSDLWSVIRALWSVFLALYDSGVLSAVGGALQTLSDIMEGLAWVVEPLVSVFGIDLPNAINAIPAAINPIFGPLGSIVTMIRNIKNAVVDLLNTGGVEPSRSGSFNDFYTTTTIPGVTQNGIVGPWAPGTSGNPGPVIPDINLEDLISSGNTALNNTYESMGGYMPDPTKGGKDKGKGRTYNGAEIAQAWVNPYQEWAAALLNEGPRVADEIRAAAREARAAINQAMDEVTKSLSVLLNDASKSFVAAVSEASVSTDYNSIASSFNALIEQFSTASADAIAAAEQSAADTIGAARASRDQMVANAQAAYDSAVRDVAAATTQKEANQARRALIKADANLNLAIQKGADIINKAERAAADMIANSQASANMVANAQAILAKQGEIDIASVATMVSGNVLQNATLAEFAYAREIVGARLEEANNRLLAAISLRDDYASAIADSVRTFGSLLTAQARTINGVQQALSAGDITSNLRDRLEKVKAFQENLRLLLANGISEEAYKQLVDAGVETGGAYAEAILAGGQGSISEVNNLTAQIGSAADALGGAAASHLYQAGVDAAQGLVDGLNSLSSELETAAWNMGNTIALAIKAALGIASPSKVAYALMHDGVGDGMVNGLDAAGNKVGRAATRLSERVMVSPEVARYAVAQRQIGSVEDAQVSGNLGKHVTWTGNIVTPTKDPHAVVTETLNELVERL